MPLFTRTRLYDRKLLLERAATAARGRGRRPRRQAIGLYREVLRREPHDPDLHSRVAPLLAREGDRAAALHSYRAAAQGFRERGATDRAVDALRDAAGRLPRERAVWLALARLELRRGNPDAARSALLEGRAVFRRRRDRRSALPLLVGAWQLAPADLDVTLDLALVLARCGHRGRALSVLDRWAAPGSHPGRLRVALRRFRVAPGPRTLWGLLRPAAA